MTTTVRPRRRCFDTFAALDHLRIVLQDMPPADRHRSISELPKRARAEMLLFMQRRCATSQFNAADAAETSSWVTDTAAQCRTVKYQHAGAAQPREAIICRIPGVLYTRYQATTQFMDLRIYSREFPTKQQAMEHQHILTKLRRLLFELEARDPKGWHDLAPEACEHLLAACGTSEQALGLRAWVQLRAHRFLGQRMRIASAAGALHDIFAVHKRLVTARATSWEALRAEWLQLRCSHKGISQQQALVHIEGARRAALGQRLALATRRVEQVLLRRLGEPVKRGCRHQCDEVPRKRPCCDIKAVSSCIHPPCS